MKDRIARLRARLDEFRAEVAKAVVGQGEVVDHLLAALLTEGHVLLEGCPGLGKTLLVRTFAGALGLSFGRVQFTPDLMPPDILGANVIRADERGGFSGFEYRRGPIFANVVLADEVNRATPKTQSALLEAMQERRVTVMGAGHELPRPFLVLATQNPIEMEGTYPLPEAQVDRFMFKLTVPYPDERELVRILAKVTGGAPEPVGRVVAAEEVAEYADLARRVIVPPSVHELAARLLALSHPAAPGAPERVTRYVRYGASPRGGIAMVNAAKARALMSGRANACEEDLVAAAPACLRHRLLLNFEGEAAGARPDDLVADLLAAAAGKGGGS